jgi:hypothetical protein
LDMDKDQEMAERGPARSGPRDSLFLLTNLATEEGKPLGRARVRNLSATGLMADCERPVPPDAAIVLELRGVGRVSGRSTLRLPANPWPPAPPPAPLPICASTR